MIQDIATSSPLVVIIDDDLAVRNSLKFSLEIDGFGVRAYANTDELMTAGGLSDCQCLIVDQNMPRTTGLELIAILRRLDILVPVILVSEHVTPTLMRQAAEAGVPVVEKPFFGHALIQQIRSAIEPRSS